MIRLVKAKYLNDNIDNFFTAKKNYTALLDWKSSLDQRNLIKKDIIWILSNDYKTKFWQDIWVTDYPLLDYALLDKLTPDKVNDINSNAKVCDFIGDDINWKLDMLRLVLLEDISGKLNNTPILINNIEDEICWTYMYVLHKICYMG